MSLKVGPAFLTGGAGYSLSVRFVEMSPNTLIYRPHGMVTSWQP